MSEQDSYRAAYERERKARLKAEQILEEKSRELFLKNQSLQESYSQLQKQQTLMLQNEKLATLGTLSAGVAHEINNPLAFVKSNVETLQQYHAAYFALADKVRNLSPELTEEQQRSLQQLFKEQDLDYIEEDLPDLMQDTVEGLARVRDIIQNLRNFSRTQSSDRYKADLVQGLQSTLKLLTSELKNSVTLKLDLQPVSEITCNPNEINQVFLNLIINAKQAMEDRTNAEICISSFEQNQQVCISIADNGCGMDESTLNEIFVPFFTTKPVGKGTGMGLAIAYSIVQDHNGEILVESQPGEGTKFILKFPIDA